MTAVWFAATGAALVLGAFGFLFGDRPMIACALAIVLVLISCL